MRLGQIKRNLGIEPSKVVSFLESKNVIISKHPNSKVTGEQLAWIINEFKPETIEEAKEENIEKKEAKVEKEKNATSKKKPAKAKAKKEKTKEEPVVGEIIEIPKETVKKAKDSEVEEEEIEVIRAPKVEIEGIKVLGKIDLPEPKVEEKEEVEETKEEEKEPEVEEIDPLAHIHPSKRAKLKVEEVITELPKPKKAKKEPQERKKNKNHKNKKVKTDANAPKGKKKKQLERDAKIAAAKKAREEQEYIKKHGKPKNIKKSKPQRIQVRADGTIIPKHELEQLEKENKPGFFARFWKWFNS